MRNGQIMSVRHYADFVGVALKPVFVVGAKFIFILTN
jgi:hypothetical protein